VLRENDAHLRDELKALRAALADLELRHRLAEARAATAEEYVRELQARVESLEAEVGAERRCVADLAERVAR
jgi:chromosome segregation ATPase